MAVVFVVSMPFTVSLFACAMIDHSGLTNLHSKCTSSTVILLPHFHQSVGCAQSVLFLIYVKRKCFTMNAPGQDDGCRCGLLHEELISCLYQKERLINHPKKKAKELSSKTNAIGVLIICFMLAPKQHKTQQKSMQLNCPNLFFGFFRIVFGVIDTQNATPSSSTPLCLFPVCFSLPLCFCHQRDFDSECEWLVE